MRYRSHTNLGFRLRHLTLKGGAASDAETGDLSCRRIAPAAVYPLRAFLSTHGLRKEMDETGHRPIATAQAPHQHSCRCSGVLAIIG